MKKATERRMKLTLNPLYIKIPEERMEVYAKLKGLLARAESIANNHENIRIRLRAMEVAVKIAQFLAGVLKDAQLEQLEAEVEELERIAEAR